LNGETIKGVYFELSREKDQLPEEGLTDPEGCYEFAIINTGSYLIRTKKAGFLPAKKVYHVTPQMLTSSENFFSLTIPLLKEKISLKKCIAIVSSNQGVKDIEFNVISEKKEL